VFVVCVNLQGLFIFCFHCVRNTTVRSEWKTTLTRIQTYSTSASNAEAAGYYRNSTPIHLHREPADLQSHEKETQL